MAALKHCFADKGYRGHGIKVGEQAMPRIFISGQKQGVTSKIKQALRRRSAVEPVIGHMKENGCFQAQSFERSHRTSGELHHGSSLYTVLKQF